MNPEPRALHTEPRSWPTLPSSSVAELLGSDLDRGLTQGEAERRLQRYGPNRLPEARTPSRWRLFARQFTSTIVLLLLAAAAVSALLGEWVDAAAIVAIVALNAGLGFVQEHRAEQSLAALRNLAVRSARVLRDGQARVIPAFDLVPGDVMLIEAGDRVAADGRIAYAAALSTSEASLTGESVAVAKQETPVSDPDTALADRASMVFFGTEVATGKGRAIVTATGKRTELGRIATLLTATEREATPLERRLDQLSGVLLWICLVVVAVVFLFGLLRGENAFDMFITAVSLAVAAVPEGLPAMVTIALALGVTRMARRHALVRRLAAVETLGSTTVICTDKTGTLTRGQMTARRYYAGGVAVDAADAARSAAVRALLETAVLCSDASLVQENGRWRAIGDPTEAALLEAAASLGMYKAELEREHPMVFEVPFDASRKRMTIVRRDRDRLVAHVKGAIDVILPRCRAAMAADGREQPLDVDAVRYANEQFARQSLRVLAMARRSLEGRDAASPQGDARVAQPPAQPAAAAFPANSDVEALERDLTLLGLAALEDPLRPEAVGAVRACRDAGIRVVMITGDHTATAAAVAAQLGLLEEGGVLSGTELDHLQPHALRDAVVRTSVYARVSAEHKLAIVRAWKELQAIVAMTGDGVNDAPALRQADVGIAMGLTGTDVAKDASDMVVTDDNFASIVAAVEEGRVIYANIQRGLQYLLSCNLSEILLMLLAALAGLPLPLLPVQILWTNLVTDGLPALALAVEPADSTVLRRPPRPAHARFLDRHRLVTISRHGLFMALAPLVAYWWEFREGAQVAEARGLAFSILVFSQLAHAFNSRHETASLVTIGPFTNRLLLLACSSAAAVQVAILTVGPLQRIFGVTSLDAGTWVMAAALGLLPIAGMEAEKLLRRAFMARQSPGAPS